MYSVDNTEIIKGVRNVLHEEPNEGAFFKKIVMMQ